jgi:hypothetical protein
LSTTPSLQVFEASTVKDFGNAREAPRHALIHFEGDDSEDGSILRYTLVARATTAGRLTVGANYHFLSDILGGIFVGVSVGYITTKIASGKLIPDPAHSSKRESSPEV